MVDIPRQPGTYDEEIIEYGMVLDDPDNPDHVSWSTFWMLEYRPDKNMFGDWPIKKFLQRTVKVHIEVSEPVDAPPEKQPIHDGEQRW